MKQSKHGLVIRALLAVVVFLFVIGSGMYIWSKQDKKSTVQKPAIGSYATCVKAGNPVTESYPSQCRANGITYTNPDQKPQTITNNSVPNQSYLTIKELGIRIPVSKADNTFDMMYTYSKEVSSEAAFFTFKRLVDYGICKTDIGVALSRSKVKNNPPYSLDNPEQLAQAGDYYYSASYGGSYCYDAENSKESEFYVSTGITSSTVTNALKKLELTPDM